VGVDHIILGIGYNGFPRGCPDGQLPWAKVSADGSSLGTKYPYVVHAEANSILNAKVHLNPNTPHIYYPQSRLAATKKNVFSLCKKKSKLD
jgi:deoxycytidylate deaminase